MEIMHAIEAVPTDEAVDTVLDELFGEEMTDVESVSVLIEEFGAIATVRSGTYGRLHATCNQIGDFTKVSELLDKGEMLYIQNNHSEEEIAANTTKGGKVKRTKMLPNDYLSAKSVLLNALEKGIPLVDDEGNPIGKSALSDAVSGKSEKTPEMKLNEALNRALKLAREIYGTDDCEVKLTVEGVTEKLVSPVVV